MILPLPLADEGKGGHMIFLFLLHFRFLNHPTATSLLLDAYLSPDADMQITRRPPLD